MVVNIGQRSFASVEDLESLVVHAATQYELNGYAEDFDSVEITDPEYDDLYRELKNLNPSSDVFKGTSPSKAKVKGSVVVHDPPMTSIAKADGDQKESIYNKWIEDCKSRLGEEIEICQSYKRDGVAIRINYVDGVLVSAGLRPRDGINGSDVTHHMKNIAGVPTKLKHPFTLSLNGEIECWLDDFAKVNAVQDENGEEKYKNPRNYTAGCLGRDHASETRDARLRVAFYSITGFKEWKKYYTTEVERAKWCNSPDGLNLIDSDGKGYFVRVLIHKRHRLDIMEEHAKNLPYYVDGVVLKINDLEQQEELGHVGDDKVNPPRSAIAWKFKEETAIATVSSIEWNASRTGRVVPTAIFDKPFVLADTENSRATCNNYGWMETQGLGPGAEVRVKKGGKIIPNIFEIITPVKDVGSPSHCPSCSQSLKIVTSSSGNKDLICSNEDCGAKHIKSWIFYITNMGGKGLGAAAMQQILNSGKVKTFADLYRLDIDDLVPHGFSERQALLALATIWRVKPEKDVKLKKSLQEARLVKQKIPAWQFFSSLGIAGAGKSAGKALVMHFKTWDAIVNASVDDLLSVDGVGDTTSKAIFDFFKNKKHIVDDLLNNFVELEFPKFGKLTGQNFVLTGNFTAGKTHWENLIQDQGGNIQGTVGKSTNYLIQEHGKTDGSPSEKQKKAEALGVKTISVPELEKILA